MGKSGSGGAEIGRQVVSAKKTWVQTERAAHEAWAGLIARAPRAAMLLHHFVALMGEKNAVVISQKTLAKMLGVTDRTVRSAIADLVAQRWISVVKLNGPGTVSAYVVNDRVAWGERRDNLPLSVFSATVVADQEDQEGALLGHGELRRIPSLYPGRCSFQAVLARSRRVSRTLTVWNRTCPALTRKRARSTATKVSWRHAANSA